MQTRLLRHRSREGCSACRRNRVKCDEQRPTCNRCYFKSEICDYGIRLIWPDESLAKGISHGRGAVKSSYSILTRNSNEINRALLDSSQYGAHFLNTSAVDIKEHASAAIPNIKRENVAKQKLSRLLWQPLPNQVPNHDATLMSFYDRVICSTATVEDTTEGNPFRGVLIPLALNSPAVLSAIQAVSAKVMTLRQPSYHEKALFYYSSALKRLVTTIDNLPKSDAGLFEACVMSILLCWFEISCDNHGRWVSHLTGLIHLLACREGTVSLPPFLADYFLFHFIVARTVLNLESIEKAIKSYSPQSTCRTSRSSTSKLLQEEVSDCSSPTAGIKQLLSSENASEMTITLLQWMRSVDLHEINAYSGLSGGLLLLINQITDLEYPSDGQKIANHSREAFVTKIVLENFDQYAPRDLLPATRFQISASAEIYRLGCLLYLHQKFTSIRAHIAVRTTSLIPLFSETQILDLACRILTHLEDNPYLTKTVANRLWPLFMAGCSANDEFLRIRILGLFKRIESDKRFWNVAPVRMLIEKIWRRRDLCADEPIVSLRKYKKVLEDEEPAKPGDESYCDWDRILRLMADFKWSLT